ncbi:MAG: DUF924 family protein [Gammaproteobacteria bacterium]
MSEISPKDILEFWFGVGPDNPVTLEQRFDQWFNPQSDPVFDDELRARFENAVTQARSGELDAWSATARGSLALLILLDQLPRNIYRGNKRAFASDHQALEITIKGVKRGLDQELNLVERVFFYIPFEHAENLEAQQEYAKHCRALDALAPPEMKEITRNCLAASAEHLDVICRFGRFPHRNPIIGRDSTPEELQWLEQHHGWGQKIEQ